MNNQTASIFSGVAIVGVAVTAILCGKATLKADEILAKKKGESKKEKLKAVLPVYIPTIVAGGITVAAIVASDVIKTNNYNSLLGTYAITTNSFNAYKNATSKLLTDDQKETVEKETDQRVVDNCNSIVEETGNGDTLFIEELTGRQFLSSIDNVYEAQNGVQNHISLGGPAKLNILYAGYGVRKSDIGSRLIWDPYQMDVDYGTVNIGFVNKKMKINGKECYLIKYIIPPNVELED